MGTAGVAMAPQFARDIRRQGGVHRSAGGRRSVSAPEPRGDRCPEVGDEERRQNRERRKLCTHVGRQARYACRLGLSTGFAHARGAFLRRAHAGSLRELEGGVRHGERSTAGHEVEDPGPEEAAQQSRRAPSAQSEAKRKQRQRGTTLRGAA